MPDAAKVIRLPDRPWPLDWEQRPGLDECLHRWETVSAEWTPDVFVDVDRCELCGAPRCDRCDDDGSRCVERRHHRTVHIFAARFEPVGGYLTDDEENHDA